MKTSNSADEKGGLAFPWFLHGLVLVIRATGGVFSLIMKEERDIMRYIVLAYVAWVAVDLFVALLWYVGRRVAFLLSGLFQHESFETSAYRPLKRNRPLGWFLQWVEDYVVEFFCVRGVCLLGFVYFAMDAVAEEKYDYVYTAPLWADVLLAIVAFGFRYHQRNDDNVKRWAQARRDAAEEASAQRRPPPASPMLNQMQGGGGGFPGSGPGPGLDSMPAPGSVSMADPLFNQFPASEQPGMGRALPRMPGLPPQMPGPPPQQQPPPLET